MKTTTRENRNDVLWQTAILEEKLEELIQAVSSGNWIKADRYASAILKVAGTVSAKINGMIDG